MTEPAQSTDLHAAWRWGVWIGSVLLVIGILASTAGLVFLGGVEPPGFPSAPTPERIHAEVRADKWLIVQGTVAALIGGGMLALGLLKLRSGRVKEEDPSAWASPAE
jgi:hypothetical protein